LNRVLIRSLSVSALFVQSSMPRAPKVCFPTFLLVFFAIPAVIASVPGLYDDLTNTLTAKRDGHGHSHHVVPLLELNETEITLHHAPTPPSYFTIDWDGDGSSTRRYPGLMILHAVLMSAAFFLALPIGGYQFWQISQMFMINRNCNAQGSSCMAWCDVSRVLCSLCAWMCVKCGVYQIDSEHVSRSILLFWDETEICVNYQV
jgi:hypothetical protein